MSEFILSGVVFVISHWHSLLSSGFFLAASCRERGQGHSWCGTFGARVLFWGVPVGLLAFLLSPVLPWWGAVLVGFAAFVGMTAIPHGAGQNLAVWFDPKADPDLATISFNERLGYLASAWSVRLYLIALALWPWHGGLALLLLPLCGVLAPLAYFLGLYLPKLSWRLTAATEWGEFLTGLFVGLAIAVVLL